MARPRANDFEEKRHALLLTAASVFASQGMEKASMSQIAAEAGISKSLLYHYYPKKDVLIFSIIQTHLAELEQQIAAADDPDLPPEDRLRRLVRTVVVAYRGADDQHKVQLNAASTLTDDAARRDHRDRAPDRAPLLGRAARDQPRLDAGERPALMPVTMSLFGMVNWVYMWFRDGGPVTREDYAHIATTLILEGIGAVR